MGKIVVSENVTLDGVVQDPTGEEEFGHGGWFGEFGGQDFAEWAKVELDEARRAAADGIPGRARGRRAPVRRDQ
jgi:hypothetical protein